MTSSQNKLLHGLLSKTGLMADKANIINGITKGRTEKSSEMDFDEARMMITWLRTKQQAGNKRQETDDPANKMRRKIISMAHEMHWHLSGTQKVDMPRLNHWCEKFGYLHKKLNSYSYNELPALVSQFTKVYKDFLNKI